MRTCVIAGAGAPTRHKPAIQPGSLVVAADGGFVRLAQWGIQADVVIGDLDSLTARPDNVPFIEFPREKDDTDMLAAIRYGLARDCRVFHIYGGTGGRFDHTLANLQCLAYLALRKARGFLYDENDVYTCLHNGSLSIPGGFHGIVSVFAHSSTARGVFLSGLKYPLRDAVLRHDYPLGVSNELTGAPACITVRDGTLLVSLPGPLFEEADISSFLSF